MSTLLNSTKHNQKSIISDSNMISTDNSMLQVLDPDYLYQYGACISVLMSIPYKYNIILATVIISLFSHYKI